MNPRSNVPRVGGLGSEELAEKQARRAEQVVPAYKLFLKRTPLPKNSGFRKRPLTDKTSYIAAYEFPKLLADNYERTFTIFRSSGSSGRPAYWPQLKDDHAASIAELRAFLERVFSINRSKTVAIVGLSLGSWIGGEHMAWALKTLAMSTPYPFTVFAPGNQYDEIIEMIRGVDPFVDQVLLLLCPSAIAHLLLRAEESGRPLSLKKLRYLVLGEAFPESLRVSLLRRTGVGRQIPLLFSVYGSADTGILGVESPASVALRQLCVSEPELAASLEIGPVVPHFFHFAARETFVEDVGGELCVTKWQGIPLIRYNLHDRVRLYRWKTVRESLLCSERMAPEAAGLKALIAAAGDGLPDLVAVEGRADSSLILCGTNLTEAMLDNAVKCKELEKLLSGAYQASIQYEGERQFLAFELECRPKVPIGEPLVRTIYRELVQSLGRVQPEFLKDWQNVFHVWDADPEKRVVQIRCLPWPTLSQKLGKQVKLRGIKR